MGRSLAVEAFDGWSIPNATGSPPSAGLVRFAQEGAKAAIASANPLTAPTGRYNCHGLVFANRRTNVPAPGINVDIQRLADRDQLIQVDQPQVGDVVLYLGERGKVDHSGLVTCIKKGPDDRDVVFVWSMWGGLGEFEHRVNVIPPHYSDAEIQYRRISV